MTSNNMIFFYLCLVFATVSAYYSTLEVNISNNWVEDFGWHALCSWRLTSNETLQSVTVSNNYNSEVVTYKPQDNVTTYSFDRLEDKLWGRCGSEGVTGNCVLTLEPLYPYDKGFVATCNVQGIYEQAIVIGIGRIALPTTAVLSYNMLDKESGQAPINCTSSGMLRPNLKWTIGDQEIPYNSTGGAWNEITKLWDVWSFLYFAEPTSGNVAYCTPEITVGSESAKGPSASVLPWNIISSIK